MYSLKRIEYKIPVLGQEQYINPLKINSADAYDKRFQDLNPDPFVLKYNGEYYCYSSGKDGVPILHSKDLISWQHLGYALKDDENKDYWAPAVIYENGVFYMYYSSIKVEEGDSHNEHMKVATSKGPEGPFEYEKTLFDNFSIDAHVIKNEKNEHYLFYSVNDYCGIDWHRPGTIILCDRLIDMMTPEGNPRPVVFPTIDEEIFEKDRFHDGRDWHTIEGAFYINRKGRHYIMYSGNAYTNKHYFVGYSTSKDGVEWRKYPDDHTYRPLLCGNDIVEGTGHNSVIKAPNNVDDWIVYHGRDVAEGFDVSKEQRKMRIDPLFWSGYSMWVPGPSYTMQDAPKMPEFRDLFDSGESLSDDWIACGGEWKVKDGEACQILKNCVASAVNDILLENYMFGISLKWEKSHMGGLYGIYACYVDSQNNVQVLLNVGKRKLCIFEVNCGILAGEKTIDIGKEFDFEVYHHMFVVKTGFLFRIFIDDILKAKVSYPFEKGCMGMVSYYTCACFDGVELTDYIELDSSNQIEFAKYIYCTQNGKKSFIQPWEIKGGKLICRGNDTNAFNEILFKNTPSNGYEFSADISCEDKSIGYSGIYPVYKDRDNYMSLVVNWENKSIKLEYKLDNEIRFGYEQDMPSDICCFDDHTLFARKIGNRIFVLLDNYIAYDGMIEISDSTVGLLCSNNAAYSHIKIAGLR